MLLSVGFLHVRVGKDAAQEFPTSSCLLDPRHASGKRSDPHSGMPIPPNKVGTNFCSRTKYWLWRRDATRRHYTGMPQAIVAHNLVVPAMSHSWDSTVAGPAAQRDNALASTCEYLPFCYHPFKPGFGARFLQPFPKSLETVRYYSHTKNGR